MVLIERHKVLMIDPPWQKRKGGKRAVRPGQGREFEYKTMSMADIFYLLDSEFFNKNARLTVFMWVIDSSLVDSDIMMADRGFKRHCRIIWNKKNGVAPAFTVRYTHEYLIWYYRGRMEPIAREFRGKFATVLEEKSRQHSRKPEAAYDMVSDLYPEADKHDVFSRENRDGWEPFGDQKDFFNNRQ